MSNKYLYLLQPCNTLPILFFQGLRRTSTVLLRYNSRAATTGMAALTVAAITAPRSSVSPRDRMIHERAEKTCVHN